METIDIMFGEAVEATLSDDDGAIDVSGGTVVLQRRVDCGDITESAATIVSATSGSVKATGLPVGHFQIRWEITFADSTVVYVPRRGWDDLVVRAINACNTFDLFVDDISSVVFPEQPAENLLRNHRKYIVDGLIDLQQKIPRLRVSHKDRTYQADTYFECGATVTDAPRGFIARVYSVLQEDCCAVLEYDAIEHDEMLCVLRDQENCGPIVEPYGMYLYEGDYIPYPVYGCLYYADSSGQTDFNSRPCRGYVSIHNGLFYIYPHLQSNEILVVEWDGIKRSWKDTDEVSWDREIHDAIEHFLEAKTARREDCDERKMIVAQTEYEKLVGKLIWQDRKEKRLARRTHCFANCGVPYSRSKLSSSKTTVTHLVDPVVDTYQELRLTINPALFASVKVLGKDSAFDGYGGIFIRQPQTTPATADDDAVFVVSSVNSAYFWQKWL